MSKELLGNLFRVGSLEVGARWLQFGNKLKPEGRKHYWNLIHLIATGQEACLSEHIKILSGYDYESNIKGLENLQSLRDKKSLLILGNHSHLGPVKGYGETLLTSYCVRKATDKEIRWVRGHGDNKPQEFTRQALDKSLDTIPLEHKNKRGKNKKNEIGGARLILRAFDNGNTVGLYPEGGSYQSLHQGDPMAGRLMLKAAKNDIPIVYAATGFEEETFSATFSILDNDCILRLGKALDKNNKGEVGQKIVDYAMARIAQHLPEKQRGYYTNFQKFIDPLKP